MIEKNWDLVGIEPMPGLKVYTAKNGVFQNSCLGCLNVNSSGTPNKVFHKPPFEGVTGHPQNTLTNDSESLKGVLYKYLHCINSQLYVIVCDFYIYEIYYNT